MSFMQANGVQTEFDDIGGGDPVFLIHGSWGNRSTWGEVPSVLAESFRVVSYDRRGHGASSEGPQAGTVHDDVSDAAALIAGLASGRATVVGNSFGANIALRLAAQHPKLVSRLICYEPPLVGLLATEPEHAELGKHQLQLLGTVREFLEANQHDEGTEFFVNNLAGDPGTWDNIPQPMRDELTAGAPTFLGELQDPDALQPDTPGLSALPMPVLLTRGDQSPTWFAPIVDLLSKHMPNADLAVVPGAGHPIAMTHPREYATLITNFINATR